jgi:hypothetical protein
MGPNQWTWVAGLVLAVALTVGAIGASRGRPEGRHGGRPWALWTVAGVLAAGAAVVYLVLLVK